VVGEEGPEFGGEGVEVVFGCGGRWGAENGSVEGVSLVYAVESASLASIDVLWSRGV
jgi:hypothetical protein